MLQRSDFALPARNASPCGAEVREKGGRLVVVFNVANVRPNSVQARHSSVRLAGFALEVQRLYFDWLE